MKKAILFDLDGTLWHTSDVILPIWNSSYMERSS